jgi:hypothetical protein
MNLLPHFYLSPKDDAGNVTKGEFDLASPDVFSKQAKKIQGIHGQWRAGETNRTIII